VQAILRLPFRKPIVLAHAYLSQVYPQFKWEVTPRTLDCTHSLDSDCPLPFDEILNQRTAHVAKVELLRNLSEYQASRIARGMRWEYEQYGMRFVVYDTPHHGLYHVVLYTSQESKPSCCAEVLAAHFRAEGMFTLIRKEACKR
jgi:hypothetical protein